MSAMDQMLAGMLKSIIPPEVMEMITPEKIQAFAQGINDFIDKQNAFQNEVLERLERLENGPGYASGSGDSGNGS
jgi:hypothetical protein